MAPLKRKRPQDDPADIPAPASETTTRRATRQTPIPPLPIQPDPEPRRRRRRGNTDEELEAPVNTQAHPTRGKENIPADPTTKGDPPRQANTRVARHRAPVPANTTTAIPPPARYHRVNPFAPAQSNITHAHPRPGAHIPASLIPSQLPKGTASTPQAAIQQQKHKVRNTKPMAITTSQPPSNPRSSSSFSPEKIKGSKAPDRNIDKVVLGDICFRAWYPSFYGKEVLGDISSTFAASNGTSTHHPPQHNQASTGKDDGGAKGHHAGSRHRDQPILDRLCVCPCCFKYSKELVTWWDHVRICEAKGHIPGKKIYIHPKGSRKVLVPAPGPTPVHKSAKGKRGSISARMVEEVIHDEGEWSIWEVDGEKDVLFCQNLSLFAKLFLDNKSVFFDVSGFTYFLLVYTPPPPPPPAPPPSRSASPRPPDDQHLPLPPPSKPHIVGFFSKEKMSWDNNNLACILIFPPWQRKGLGSLLMGISYEISRREGVLGGPEKPISDLGKKGYKRFWAGEIARWLLGLDVGDEETVVDVGECSRATWIVPEDCLLVLREMGVLEEAGMGPRLVKVGEREREKEVGCGGSGGGVVDAAPGEGVPVEVVEERKVPRVRVSKDAVRRWVAANCISLDKACDPHGFIEGYAMAPELVEEQC